MQEKKEIFDKLLSWGAVVFYSLVGIGAKIAHINMGQKITKRQAVTAIFAGFFGGIVCGLICDYYKIEGHLKSAFVSISALSGENIVAWLLGNVNSILDKFKTRFLKDKK